MNRFLAFLVMLILVGVLPMSCKDASVHVASKKFTESVILGEIVAQSIESSDVAAKHFQELGGTRVAFNALVDGEIDIYPEYTGTIRQELFAGEAFSSPAELDRARSAEPG